MGLDLRFCGFFAMMPPLRFESDWTSLEVSPFMFYKFVAAASHPVDASQRGGDPLGLLADACSVVGGYDLVKKPPSKRRKRAETDRSQASGERTTMAQRARRLQGDVLAFQRKNYELCAENAQLRAQVLALTVQGGPFGPGYWMPPQAPVIPVAGVVQVSPYPSGFVVLGSQDPNSRAAKPFPGVGALNSRGE